MFIGFDIGGTKTSVIVGNEKLEILEKVTFQTNPEKGFKNFLERLLRKAKDIVKGYGIDAIGVSIGGPLDAEKGVIFNPPHLPWGEVNLKGVLEKIFKCPVKVEHDAKACALAEWKYGAGRGCKNMIFLTLGTGLGAGLIIDGKLYRGATGFAGEVGHIRVAEKGPIVYGKEGSWESFCSGKGIAKLAHFMFPEIFEENVTTKEIADQAFKGNKYAIEVLKESGKYLGIGIAILIDIFNPDAIVLGNLSWRLPQIWLEKAFEVVEKEALSNSRKVCRIVRSELKDRLGDIAALLIAQFAWKNIEY
ncbi:ROK family protein [Thermotoga sp. KOL6]|uniref:ROK family protein n=1 Tax=Thermotoga sp. KOL6 TaxID=126741 RepID=UPI0018EBD4BF|nr:ROK family protein [Thermotoga sp. KOL6]